MWTRRNARSTEPQGFEHVYTRGADHLLIRPRRPYKQICLDLVKGGLIGVVISPIIWLAYKRYVLQNLRQSPWVVLDWPIALQAINMFPPLASYAAMNGLLDGRVASFSLFPNMPGLQMLAGYITLKFRR
jgi:hypothetical protein